MKEIEVKFLEIDSKKIRSMLENIGAIKKFDGDMEAVFFDYPDFRLKNSGKLLRLRTKGDHCELTFKSNVSRDKVKILDEFEVTLNDFGTAKEIFSNMGFVEVKEWKTFKHRVSYYYDNASFEIDTIPGYPTFLEIEAKNAKEIERHAKKLGLDMKDSKPWSSDDVVKYYSHQ